MRDKRSSRLRKARGDGQPASNFTPSRKIPLFGCEIDAIVMDEAIGILRQWIEADDETCRFVVTPNLHHAAILDRDEQFRQAYADAGLVLADGMPLILASRLLRRPLPERVAGSDLVPALFDAYRHGHLRVYLLGAAEGVAATAAAKIEEHWPGVKVVGYCSPPMGFEKDPVQNNAILRDVAEAGPDVLVVGLGAPKQELWVYAHRSAIHAKAALCVGATIDFLAGHKCRAPRWMQRCGLEWLHRMATEPKRLTGRYIEDAIALGRLLWKEMKSKNK